MSGIQRLKIKGIRAFSEDKPAIIEVLTPLTIIVGTNGAGKTTLLECMKYATTGGLPPNSKNGAFIHDPLLSKEGETKAQVLMKFSGCTGKEYLLLRTMVQTTGRAKRETKTLESALWEISGKDKKLICNKLSSLDSEVPLLLGTSSAVLEHVIFCHQEESTWPLSDPSAVKKKMDGIFSSSKFTRAQEALVALKKEKSSDLKVLLVRHEGLVQRMHIKKRIEERVRKIREREKEISIFLGKKQEDLESLYKTLHEEKKKKEIILSYLREKERNESELIGLQRNSLIDLPLEKLENMVETVQKRSPEETELSLRGVQAQKEEVLLRVMQYEQRRRQVEEAKKEETEKRREIKAIEDISIKKLLEVFPTILPENELICGLSNNTLKNALSKLYTLGTSKAPLSEITEQLSNIVSQSCFLINTESEKIEYEDKRLSSLYREERECISMLRERLTSLGFQRTKKISLLEEIKEDTRENEEYLLEELKEQRKKIEEEREETKDNIIGRMEELKESLQSAMRESEKRKEKQFLNDELERKRKVYQEKVFHLNLKEDAIEIIEEKEKVLKENIKKIEIKIKENEEAAHILKEKKCENDSKIKAIALIKEKKLKRVIDLLSKVESIKEITKAEIIEAVKEGRFLLLSLQREECLLEEQEKIGGLKASKSIYTRFLEKAENSCPFCKASLSDILAKPHIQKIQNILREIEEREEEAKDVFLLKQMKQKKIKEYNEVILQINEVLSVEEYFTLSVQEPLSYSKEENLQGSLQTSIKSLVSLQEAKDILKDILYLKEREEKIRVKEEDPESEYKRCIKELEDLQETERKENHLHEEQERARDRSRKRAREIEDLLYKRKRIKADPIALQEEIKKIEEDIEKNEELLRSKEEEAQQIEKKEEILRIRKKTLKNLEIDRGILTYFLTEKTKVEEIEKRLVFLSKEKHVEESQEESMLLIEKKKQLEEEERFLIKTLHEEREEMLRKEMIIQSIRAQKLKKRIEESPYLPMHLTEKESIIREKEVLYQKTVESISEVKGEAGNLKKQKEEDEKEIVLYKGAEEEELSAYVEMKVLKESLLDIEKYIKAVQKGIVRYHAEKLQEVNAIIKEIWDMTYKGGDIDNIRIVAQMDKAYTLMMERDGVEVEMRGRVSAGQKMLASIVVRLALAEAFSINCGLLSLDEPTTNLDKKNIHSLAKGLSSIIQARRAEGSFQLLVITHDEEFVRELLKTECTEYFYRLERDTDNQPTIQRFSIYE
ncbi:DNA repair protein RAD50 [Nematocida sp. LUAm3]|nr:DNA repair protein RAD50 [Nematocida sp. LUAm3]KAI5175897.1 DNA repair protein RAD50 [Nematocida sp. LUAm2]KAI5178721.1 DNA repair protein RAD50 [Nematocida sp. LUAm1]